MNPYMYNKYPHHNMDDNRFFPAGAFLLGALTGGVAAAGFNPYRPRLYYPINSYPMYPYPYPYPYYR